MEMGKYRGSYNSFIEIKQDSVIYRDNLGIGETPLLVGKCIKKNGKTILYLLPDIKRRHISHIIISDTVYGLPNKDAIFVSLEIINDYWASIKYRNTSIYLNDSLVKKMRVGPSHGIEMLIPRKYEKYHFTVKHRKINTIETDEFSTQNSRYITINLLPKKQKIKPQKKVIRYSKKDEYWYMGKRKWGQRFKKI